ncbi:MAG TPA: PAS domain S-box protein [Leptolyngbyaceae cyanobacterium M33_DOE_097]|nr:PAS domain S-box protein [Leptolyngbyaceae cyanobacterium M33_DOE_097]
MEQLLELPPGLDNLFQVWSERLHPDDRDRVTTKIQTALATQTAFSDKYRYQLQDGRFVWRWVMGQGIYTATGEVKRALGIVQDITDRKRTEIALRTAEERYSLATRAARVGVWEWHLTTNQIYIDPNVKALAGYTNEEFPSDIEHWLQIAHPEDRDRIMSVVKDYLTGKIPELAFEHRIVHKNGSMIWVLVRGELLCDEQGNPKCLIGTNTDISELKQAELALRRSEATKNAIIQAIPDLLVRMDRDGHHQELICNEYLQVLRPDSPIHAATVRDILPFNQTEQRLQYTNLALDTGQLQVYEQALELDGQLRHEEVRIIPLLNQEVLVIVRDITDRKQAEFALREKQQQLKSLLNNIPHIAWLKDRDGRFLAVNEPFAQACGFPLAQLIGLTDLDIWPQHLAEAYIQDDREVMASGQQKRVEEPLLTPEGLEKWIETIKTPILNEYGESIGTAGIAMDITERRRAEVAMQQLNEELERRIQRRTQELARSEQDLRTIFNNVYDAILIHDMDGNILDCNDRSLELFAVTREQLLAANVANLAVEAAQPESISATMQRVEAGETLRFEWQARRFSDGAVLEVEVSLQKVTLANRAVTIAGVRDIRDRKQAERDLQESRNMFKLVLDTIPQRVFWKDRQSRFLGCNPAFANDYHLGNEEIIGKTDLELPWALWADLYRGDDARVMDTNCPKLDYEEPTINLDGEQIWIRSSKIPLTNTQGEVIGVLGCYDDITDRKQTEQALRDSEERLRLALTATAQGLYDLDLQTGKAIVSPEYASMLGYDPATFEETSTKWIERLHPDDVEAVTLAYRAYVAGEIPDYNIEFRQRTQDGKWKWILSLGRIVAWNESGQPLRMLGTHTDIDDRKQAEAALQQLNLELEQRVSDRTLELQKAMEAAEAANRAKSTFLANMSHELRTPLNAILGFAQLMARKLTLEPEQRNQLSIINRSGNHLLNLINDILEMSKIEAGRSTFVKNRFDFYSMLDSLEEMFHFRAIEKGLQLIINRGSALPRYIETDENKLRQVLINLIGNAVKFTLAGRVMLRVTANLSAEEGTQAEPSREQSITLCFEVTDTGIGISPDEIDSLFEPFIQSSA